MTCLSSSVIFSLQCNFNERNWKSCRNALLPYDPGKMRHIGTFSHSEFWMPGFYFFQYGFEDENGLRGLCCWKLNEFKETEFQILSGDWKRVYWDELRFFIFYWRWLQCFWEDQLWVDWIMNFWMCELVIMMIWLMDAWLNKCWDDYRNGCFGFYRP